MKTVIHNAKVYVERGHFEQAVLISGGIIEAVGSSAAILAAAPGGCRKIDAGGRTVLPGMNDSHQHLGFVGEFLALCNLGGARSIDEIVERGRAFIAQNPEAARQGVHGVGYNQDYFADEKRLLTRHDLDRISTDLPIVFERVCGHIVAANTRAIELAGITAQTPQFEGGVFEIGPDGRPNGIFNENAIPPVMKALPETTPEERERLYKNAIAYAVSVGLTSVQSNDAREGSDAQTFALLRKLRDQGDLLLRYRHQINYTRPESFARYLETEFVAPGYDDHLALGPLKLFKDGSLGARTALMRADYHDEPGNRGVDALSAELMDALCALAARAGVQVVTHVIGDAAVAQTLDAYEKSMAGGPNTLRHALVHCQITDRPLLERIARLGVLVLAQPIFLNYDLHVVESRVGHALAQTSYAFGTLAKLGASMAFGTDAPVEDCNPFPCIYSAVTRSDLEGHPEGGFAPHERIDVTQAIDCYTLGSACAEFQEHIKGRVKPGYYADLIALDRDIFTIPEHDIQNVKVDWTMVDGKMVYTR